MRTLVLAAFIVLGFSFGLMTDHYFAPATVEAQVERSEARFQFQALGKWDYSGKSNNNIYYTLAAICDTYTGTLIYSSGDKGGIWGVPNSCAKNPR